MLECFNQTLSLIGGIIRVLGPRRFLGPQSILGSCRVLDLQGSWVLIRSWVLVESQVPLGSWVLLGSWYSQGPGSSQGLRSLVTGYRYSGKPKCSTRVLSKHLCEHLDKKIEFLFFLSAALHLLHFINFFCICKQHFYFSSQMHMFKYYCTII